MSVLRAFLVLALGASAATGAAQDAPNDPVSAEYQRLTRLGEQEDREGRLGEAYALYLRAFGVFPNARILRVLGNTALTLRNYPAAVVHYRAAMASQVRELTAEQRTDVQSRLDHALTYVDRVRLLVSPSSATVEMDGEPVSSSEQLLVPIGRHTVVARAEGYESMTRTLVVEGGRERSESLQLLVGRAPAPVETAAFRNGPVTSPQREASSLQTAGWIAVGLGGGLLVLGVVATVVNQDVYRDFIRMGCDDVDSATCDDLRSEHSTSRVLEWVGYVGAGTLIIGGVVVGTIGGADDGDGQALVRCIPALSMLECHGHF